MYVLLNGIDILGVLLGGVGIIHAQVADAAKMLSGAEIYGQRLAVADVEIAVRLRREAGVNLHPIAALPLGEILLNKGLDEISCCFFHISSLS